MTPLQNHPLPDSAMAQPLIARTDDHWIDSTLGLLRDTSAREGLERRILLRMQMEPLPARHFSFTRFLPRLMPSSGLAGAAVGLVACATLGTALFLANNRPAAPLSVPARALPVAHSVIGPAAAVAYPRMALRTHSHGHRRGRAVHARVPLPHGVAMPTHVAQQPTPVALVR